MRLLRPIEDLRSNCIYTFSLLEILFYGVFDYVSLIVSYTRSGLGGWLNSLFPLFLLVMKEVGGECLEGES